MEKLKFQININSTKEKVWQVLWDDQSYREWTSVFSPGSYAKSDWKEGSKVLFLNGEGNGMYALIEKKIPNEQMTFLHQGEVKKGIETKADWGEGRESYYLQNRNGKTELMVELDAPADFVNYFNETFPKALNKVKQLSEK